MTLSPVLSLGPTNTIEAAFIYCDALSPPRDPSVPLIGNIAGASPTTAAKEPGDSVIPTLKKLEERYVQMCKAHGPSSELAGLGLQHSDKPLEGSLGYHYQLRLRFK